MGDTTNNVEVRLRGLPVLLREISIAIFRQRWIWGENVQENGSSISLRKTSELRLESTSCASVHRRSDSIWKIPWSKRFRSSFEWMEIRPLDLISTVWPSHRYRGSCGSGKQNAGNRFGSHSARQGRWEKDEFFRTGGFGSAGSHAAAAVFITGTDPHQHSGARIQGKRNRLFGTDGIRTRAGEFPLNAAAVSAIGQAIGEKLGGRILVGQDTRLSSPWIFDS